MGTTSESSLCSASTRHCIEEATSVVVMLYRSKLDDPDDGYPAISLLSGCFSRNNGLFGRGTLFLFAPPRKSVSVVWGEVETWEYCLGFPFEDSGLSEVGRVRLVRFVR